MDWELGLLTTCKLGLVMDGKFERVLKWELGFMMYECTAAGLRPADFQKNLIWVGLGLL